jgi:iron(III) transport system substrate-binding protein
MKRLRSPAPLRAGALLAAGALVLAACGGGSEQPASQAPQGSGAGGGRQAVCDAAAREGTLVYWNDFANPDGIFDAFNDAYPDIQVDSLQLRPDDAAQRALAEHTAGKQPTPDLLHGGLDVFSSLIDAGMIDTSVDWKSLGVPADVIITQTAMIRLQRDPGGLVYNTEKLKPEDLPSSWEELIDPKWAGQVAVDPRGRPWDQLSLAWGQDKTLDFVRRLKQVVRPVMITGATAGIVAVASGEALMGTGGLTSEVEAQKRKGAPVALKYLDTVPTLDADNAVVAKARHPNAAKCFTSWVVTDGSKAFQEAELKTNETSPSSADGAKVTAIDTTSQAQQVADMSEEVGALLR